MLEREKIIKLYDIYKNLLTQKQKDYFELYYFEDFSLSEISSELNVSKSFAGKTIKKVSDKLSEYERLLKLFEINEKLKEIVKNTKDTKTKEELNNLIK